VARKGTVSTQDKANNAFNLVNLGRGVREELTKIVWPSRQQLISESVAVILMVALSATIIYFLDSFLGWAAQKVF